MNEKNNKEVLNKTHAEQASKILDQLERDIVNLENITETLGHLHSFITVGGKVVQMFNSIRDVFFREKLYKFLYQLEDISKKDKEEFVKKMNEDPAHAKKAGRFITVILDKLDEDEKAEMLGRAFKAYVEGKIKYDNFHQISTAIERFQLCHKNVLKMLYFYFPLDDNECRQFLQEHSIETNSLLFCGLISFISEDSMVTNTMGYKKNEIGGLFIQFVLDKNKFE